MGIKAPYPPPPKYSLPPLKVPMMISPPKPHSRQPQATESLKPKARHPTVGARIIEIGLFGV